MEGNNYFPTGIQVSSQGFKQIPEKLLEEARSNAYSLERREKQGGLEYLGSEIPGAQKRAGVDGCMYMTILRIVTENTGIRHGCYCHPESW